MNLIRKAGRAIAMTGLAAVLASGSGCSVALRGYGAMAANQGNYGLAAKTNSTADYVDTLERKSHEYGWGNNRPKGESVQDNIPVGRPDARAWISQDPGPYVDFKPETGEFHVVSKIGVENSDNVTYFGIAQIYNVNHTVSSSIKGPHFTPSGGNGDIWYHLPVAGLWVGELLNSEGKKEDTLWVKVQLWRIGSDGKSVLIDKSQSDAPLSAKFK